MRAAGGPKPTRNWQLHAALVLVLLVGASLTGWRIRSADRHLREELLQDLTVGSWALRTDDISSLSGSHADLSSIAYQRVKRQLQQGRHLYPLSRFLYIMRKDADGELVFLADSEPPDSPEYSPPGEVYKEASPDLLAAFAEAKGTTEGPVADRWGNWVSAFVPLFHPVDDRLVGVLGIDIDASSWRQQLLRPAIPPVLTTLGLLLALLLTRDWKRRLAGSPPAVRLWWGPDVALALLVGLLITALVVHETRATENMARRDIFRRKAALQASLLQQLMFRIGSNYLEGFARFFLSTAHIKRAAFEHYVTFLTIRPYALAWTWTPIVPASEADVFKQHAEKEGAIGYRIWEWDPDGGRRDAAGRDLLYPIHYIEPGGTNSPALGFDEGSDPLRRAAILEAVATGLPTATDPVHVPQDPDGARAIVVYRATTSQGAREPNGICSVTLEPDILLYRALSRESTRGESSTIVDLYQLTDDGAAIHLASNQRNPPRPPHDLPHSVGHPDTMTAPLYAFGKVYAIVARPNGDDDLNPARSARGAAAVGLLLTALMTALVAALTSRRAALEELVQSRTTALRESESSYHGLFNSIRQAIYIQDHQGRFLDVNDGAVAMYGFSREELIGRTPEFVSAPGRNDMGSVIKAVQEAWNGKPQQFEFWGIRKNGDVFPKDVWLSKGSYFGQDVIIAVAADTSDRRKAEQERSRLSAQLQQAQKMESIGRLAGGVAHDFNNMLQAIIGNATLSLEDQLPGPVRESFEEIKRAAERSAELTRQLLTFASRQPARPRVIDLNTAIHGMLKILRRLIGEDIQLEWIPGANLWPVKIDPGQADQIMTNLAVNARDAIAGVGRIRIETVNCACKGPACSHGYAGCQMGQYVLIRVSDNGKGMDEETRAHIFEPFFTTKGPGKGVGLGLATVFGIVKQNDGFIDVQSSPASGTSFTIGLPHTFESPVKLESSSQAPALRGGTETILLVEDEKAVLRFGLETLKRYGYNVLSAGSPLEAIEIAKSHTGRIHLLITDVVLPSMNGRELAQLLSSMVPGIRSMFISGYTADIIATRGVIDENVHFIQKPFSVDHFIAKVRSVLDKPDDRPV